MTERLAEVSRRLATFNQLAEVVGAMRALAAARAREARARLDGVRAYARDIADAIGRALPLADHEDADPPRAGDALALLVFGAEQGFAGGFNSRLLDAADAALQKAGDRPTRLLLVGSRALSAAEARGRTPDWFHPMVAHLDRAADLAEAVAARLFEGLASGEMGAIQLIHAAPGGAGATTLVERRLAPFDYSRFPALKAAEPPVITLAPEELIAKLAEEYIFAEIVEAAILSFAAENEARLMAMTNARRHIDQWTERLNGRARMLRQDEITNEIVELAADADAMAAP